MLKTLRGSVAYYKSIGRHTAQLELSGIRKVIELACQFPYVLNEGDVVQITGEENEDSGKFLGFAYVNETRGVRGSRATNYVYGYAFVIASILFCWAIFPLFAHLRIPDHRDRRFRTNVTGRSGRT
jgi:hypothetical protein